MEETIEFTVYPIWERQQEEDPDDYEKFFRFYLYSPKGSVNGAYNSYLLEKTRLTANSKTKRKGRKSTTNTSPTMHGWDRLAKKYRWSERRIAYFDEQRRNEDGWIRQKETSVKMRALEGVEKGITTANLMLGSPIFTKEVIQRHPDGTPIQTIINPVGFKHADGSKMLLELMQVANQALGITPTQQAIEQLEREGFVVSNPAIIDFMREQGQAMLENDETPVMQPEAVSQPILEQAEQ